VALSEAVGFDPSDPEFLADPYPVLNRLREQAPLFYDAARERWFVTRHEDVRSCLRDKRLGRNFRQVLAPEEIGVPPLDPRWQAFWDSERWSLLWLEPPDHTRLRKLVAASFTPRSVEALEHRQHERGGLAGPRLGPGEDVPTGQDEGDRLALDGGGFRIALLGDGADELGRQPELIE